MSRIILLLLGSLVLAKAASVGRSANVGHADTKKSITIVDLMGVMDKQGKVVWVDVSFMNETDGRPAMFHESLIPYTGPELFCFCIPALFFGLPLLIWFAFMVLGLHRQQAQQDYSK